MGHRNIQIKSLCHKDIMFGITDEEDWFVNHILLIAKKYIYSCRCNKAKPSIIAFKAQVKKIYQLEEKIAQFNNKWPIHQKKWGKYIEVETITCHNMLKSLYCVCYSYSCSLKYCILK